MQGLVKLPKFGSDEEFAAWFEKDIEAVSFGAEGNEAYALKEGARLEFELAPIKARYAAAKKIWLEAQPEAEVEAVPQSLPAPAPSAPAPPSVAKPRVLKAFVTGKSGTPSTYINAKLALENMALDCRYDVFHDRMIVKGYEVRESGEASENLDNVALKVRDAVIRG